MIKNYDHNIKNPQGNETISIILNHKNYRGIDFHKELSQYTSI